MGAKDSRPLPSDAEQEQEEKPSQRREAQDAVVISARLQAGLVVFTALYTTIFSGAIFGWGPMQLLLEADGAFSSVCNGDEALPCNTQTLRLVQVQLIATLMAAFSPLLGLIADFFGALRLMQLAALMGCSGIAIAMIASATKTDELYFLAFALLGLVMYSTSILIIQTGLTLRSAARRRVISLLNGLLQVSSVTYLVLHEIAKATGASFITVMGGYLGVAIFCYGGAVFLWMAVVRKTELALSDNPEHNEDLRKIAMDQEEATNEDVLGTKSDQKTHLSHRKTMLIDDSEQEKMPNDEPPGDWEDKGEYVLIAQRKPWDQLKSLQFVLVCCFYMFHVSRNNWTMATARGFLASLGDDEQGNKYLSIFTGLSLASLMGLPFVDVLLSKCGYHVGFQVVNVLAMIHGFLQILTVNLNVQVAGFVVFSFYRCFIFAVTYSFLPVFLGGSAIGRGAGFVGFVGAVFNLVNIGLATWVFNVLGDDFFFPNLLYTVGVLPVMGVAWQIGRCIRMEEEATSHISQDVLDHSYRTSVRMSRRLSIVNPPADFDDTCGSQSLQGSHHSSIEISHRSMVERGSMNLTKSLSVRSVRSGGGRFLLHSENGYT